ncbi:hypothetical protein T10_7699 [Trichinella papuae]|uniref:Uncharacterized protein n=1 Tax=Trichinella papuae TaxID=268474 RepID=A0A0V1ML56_9BILA|nr:hypothetical protein T10_7699 [Trichinella papuae]
MKNGKLLFSKTKSEETNNEKRAKFRICKKSIVIGISIWPSVRMLANPEAADSVKIFATDVLVLASQATYNEE